MKLTFLYVETTRASWLEKLREEYATKISRFLPFEYLRVKSPSRSRQDSYIKVKEEFKTISKLLSADSFVILCDEHGQDLDSVQFSKKLQTQIESGKKRIIVIIGGPFGVDEALKQRANWQLKLSSLTLSHTVAQAVMLEQLYRALTIWKGIKYHNE